MSQSNDGRDAPDFSRIRRQLLLAAGGMWVAGTFAATAPTTIPVPISVGTPRRGLVDIHHHYSNLQLQQWWGQSATQVQWTAAQSITAMDEAGVDAAILSITQPGVWKGADVDGSVKLARTCNEGMARLAQDHRGRFGFFAAVPLASVQASVAEVGYCLDALKADGIGMLSSYDGKYLGDPVFAPVLEELNARRAVVYVHPMVGTCCANLVPGIVPTALEAPMDTHRAIESLLVNGALARYSAIRFIFAHGGGSLPMLADRMMTFVGPTPPGKDYLSPANMRAALASLYFDCAAVVNPPSWAALTTFTTPDRIMFGTDFPQHEIRSTLGGLRAMEQRFGLTSVDAQRIESGTARQLFSARLS
jgi:6-methylsalicylate decarboxylase